MKIELCPSCGSGKIYKTGALTGDVNCDSCRWAGKEEQLISGRIPDRPADIAIRVAQQYLVQLSKQAALDIGTSIIESGLLPVHLDKNVLVRVVRAAVLGAHKATLDEIDTIQKEQANVSTRS